MIEDGAASFADAFSLPEDGEQRAIINALVARLFDFEGWFVLPDIDWRERRSIADYWDVREELQFQKQLLADFKRTDEQLTEALFRFLWPIYGDNAALRQPAGGDDIAIPTELV